MRRKFRRNNKIPITLFSFLDILGGTIGILTLIISIFMIQMSMNNEVVNISPIPGSFKDRKILSYIVCNGDGEVIVHHNQITTKTDLKSKLVANILIDIEKRKNHLIIAVRPNSFKDFRDLRNRVEKLNIIAGYQPIDQNWQIKFPEI